MKPLPAPEVPGNTPWQRFDNAMSRVLAAPKLVVEKEKPKAKAKAKAASRKKKK